MAGISLDYRCRALSTEAGRRPARTASSVTCGSASRIEMRSKVEPAPGFEPRTCCLQDSCSTPELCRRNSLEPSIGARTRGPRSCEFSRALVGTQKSSRSSTREQELDLRILNGTSSLLEARPSQRQCAASPPRKEWLRQRRRRSAIRYGPASAGPPVRHKALAFGIAGR